jgi:pilus assembly protein CpaB
MYHIIIQLRKGIKLKKRIFQIIKDTSLVITGITSAGFGLKGFLLPNQFIDGGAIRWKVVDKDYPRELFIKKGSTNLSSNYGATVRKFVKKGELLTYALVVKSGEPGFLASVLRPGMRAVAIPTNAVASNAGLVSAGDRVDVILGLSGKGNHAAASSPQESDTTSVKAPELASQTLITNVRVLALNNVAHSGLQVRSDHVEHPKEKDPYLETVTLEVTPKQAEQLAVAREIGTLQLALRSVDDFDTGTDSDKPLAASGKQTQVTTLNQVTDIYRQLNDINRSPSTPKVTLYMGNKTQVTHVTN